MKKYLSLILVVVFALMAFSCGDFFESVSGGKSFWALDYTKSPVQSYRVSAELLASNELCEVWVEKGSGVSEQQAKSVANEYKNAVYVKMMKFFGWEVLENGTRYNVMDIADMMGDGNGKLNILLLDIKDGYKKGVNDSYVAGYFYAYNFFDVEESNVSDMIYMDTYPSSVGADEFYSTLAHEMQHLINFITTAMFRSEVNENNEIIDLFLMDTWIDEGLSAAAEWVYLGKPDESRIRWYNEDRTGFISKGDNFYVWDNYKENPSAVLNEYATVSMFFHWLRLQFGNDIYFNILTSLKSDYLAVEEAQEYTKWPGLLKMWHTANKINNTSSYEGYKNDSLLKDIKANYLSSNDKQWELYPGEAVYTYSLLGTSTPDLSGSIRYLGMSDTNVSGNIPAKGTLLTYNIDTRYNNADKNSGTATPGTITGEKPPSKPVLNMNSSDNSRALSGAMGSNRIDAGDIIRRKGVAHSDSSRSVVTREARPLPKISRENITRYNASNE